MKSSKKSNIRKSGVRKLIPHLAIVENILENVGRQLVKVAIATQQVQN